MTKDSAQLLLQLLDSVQLVVGSPTFEADAAACIKARAQLLSAIDNPEGDQ